MVQTIQKRATEALQGIYPDKFNFVCELEDCDISNLDRVFWEAFYKNFREVVVKDGLTKRPITVMITDIDGDTDNKVIHKRLSEVFNLYIVHTVYVEYRVIFEDFSVQNVKFKFDLPSIDVTDEYHRNDFLKEDNIYEITERYQTAFLDELENAYPYQPFEAYSRHGEFLDTPDIDLGGMDELFINASADWTIHVASTFKSIRNTLSSPMKDGTYCVFPIITAKDYNIYYKYVSYLQVLQAFNKLTNSVNRLYKQDANHFTKVIERTFGGKDAPINKIQETYSKQFKMSRVKLNNFNIPVLFGEGVYNGIVITPFYAFYINACEGQLMETAVIYDLSKDSIVEVVEKLQRNKLFASLIPLVKLNDLRLKAS